MLLAWIILIFVLLVAMARLQFSFAVWTAIAAGVLLLTWLTGMLPGGLFLIFSLVFGSIAAVLNKTQWRKKFVTGPVLSRIRALLPPISDTEREAIEAGTVWWEAELFSGHPDWNKLAGFPAPKMTDEEQAFLDGPVEILCSMLDDWQITHELNDLPPEVWAYMAEQGFFGLNIPKEFGGLGFSPLAQSTIVMKVCSRSGTAGVTVMVPNSLGPAELLLHYGTEEQKNHYLPRLAKGKDIPCFGLTNPWAGSDAGAMPDIGIVCKQQVNGQETLGFRINWEKRYITLGPVATVLGLAFKAFDPDGLLGDQKELGITCALIPADTHGVKIGDRHLPLNAAFQNGPNWGKDVFVPMDWIIGGQEQVGKGWRMLMESLAAGRGISLPASGVSAAKMASRTTGAYARIREQFGIPIGKFEGIEEALARIGGLTYMMDAARLLTTVGLVMGEKPSVISAIVKYHLTDGARQVINDAMDVHGGKGICMGPNNYLARGYQQIPIAITVEGANILTRSMIIFGQGAMRCHPFLLKEIEAANDRDKDRGLNDFDAAMFQHIGHVVTNACRAFVYGISRGWLAPAQGIGEPKKYYLKLARLSAAYALLADVALLILGGDLKRKEKLSGRFADALSFMYLASASLKRYQDTGQPAEDLPLLDWSCQHALHQIEQALDGILRNFPVKVLGIVLRGIVFPLGRRLRAPDDYLGRKVARLLQTPSATRNRLTEDVYLPTQAGDVTGKLEYALDLAIQVASLRKRLRDSDLRQPEMSSYKQWLGDLLAGNHITQEELDLLEKSHDATLDVISVDHFEPSSVSESGIIKDTNAIDRTAA